MQAKTIGNIMMWGSIAAMILTMMSIETLHLSHEITTVIMVLFFIIFGLSHSYLNARISDIKNDYLLISTGIGSHIKDKMDFYDIKNIEVVYGWYDADLIINFKKNGISGGEKTIKYHLVDWESFFRFRIPVIQSPGNRVEEWLFPLLDKLYDKCPISVKQQKFFLNIAVTNPLKTWHPPGESNKSEPKSLKRKNIIAYVVFGIIVAITISMVIVSILSMK